MGEKEIKRVLVLGNGFDLDLGSDTSYFTYASTHFNKRRAPCPLYEYLASKYEETKDKNWFDFEAEIASYLTIVAQQGTINHQVIQADKKYFENELLPLCKYMDIVGWKTPYNERDKYVDKNIETNSSLFKNSVQLEVRKQSVAFKLLELIARHPNHYSRIITFNYTKLPIYVNNALSDVYDCGPDIIRSYGELIGSKMVPIHIEGSENDKRGVLGVSDSAIVPNGYDFLRKSVQISPERRESAIKTIFEADELVIFGHSIGDSDSDYFQPVFADMFKERLEQTAMPSRARTITFITYRDNKGILTQIQKMAAVGNILFHSNYPNLRFIYTDQLESQWTWLGLENGFGEDKCPIKIDDPLDCQKHWRIKTIFNEFFNKIFNKHRSGY